MFMVVLLQTMFGEETKNSNNKKRPPNRAAFLVSNQF